MNTHSIAFAATSACLGKASAGQTIHSARRRQYRRRNMYKHLGETEAGRQTHLKMLKAWIGEVGWNLNRWGPRGEVPGISKEQMDKVQVKY